MVLHLPGQKDFEVINKRTGHIDIVPTILHDFLGYQNNILDYSSGKSLLDKSIGEDGFILTSYKDKAYLIGNNVYSKGLFVRSYDVNDFNKINTTYNYKSLQLLRKQENVFFKKINPL